MFLPYRILQRSAVSRQFFRFLNPPVTVLSSAEVWIPSPGYDLFHRVNKLCDFMKVDEKKVSSRHYKHFRAVTTS